MGDKNLMAMTLITTNTSSGAASSSFTSGIDSTYKLYIFKFYDVHPATNEVKFTFQANASGQSGYNETIDSTFFTARHSEDDSSPDLYYGDAHDQSQGTAFQQLAFVGNDADWSVGGELFLFNPSNTTYVKHFYCTNNCSHYGDATHNPRIAGYFDTTTAIDDIQFKMTSGNMDAVIRMYGVG